MYVNNYFKSEFHEELYKTFLAKLNNHDKFYSSFAYLASAVQKKQIATALSDHSINNKKLLEMSKPWSSSEKAMLEAAFQGFTGRNLYYDEHDLPIYPTLNSIMWSLDSDNSRIVIEAFARKYIR